MRPSGSSWSTTTACSARGCAPSWTGTSRTSPWWARRAPSTRRWPRSATCVPTWGCWTSTCPTAAARRGPPPPGDRERDLLPRRERDVLRLLARGYAYKEIAGELFISVKTVETHVSSVLRKTQLSNRYELSRWASDRRLV